MGSFRIFLLGKTIKRFVFFVFFNFGNQFLLIKNNYCVLVSIVAMPSLIVDIGMPGIVSGNARTSSLMKRVLDSGDFSDIVVRGRRLHRVVLQARCPMLLVENDADLDVSVLSLDEKAFEKILQFVYWNRKLSKFENQEIKAATKSLMVSCYIYLFIE